MEAQADNSAGCSLPWGAPNPTLSHREAPHHGGTHPGPSKGMGDVPRMGPGLCCEHPKIGQRLCLHLSTPGGHLGTPSPATSLGFSCVLGSGEGGTRARAPIDQLIN